MLVNELIILFLAIGFCSCCKEKLEDKPNGGANSVVVYNQAYQENFEEDQIKDILANASNGYVLLDPYQDGVNDHVSAIKSKGNEVSAYISIGTGEDYRSDFDQLEPFLVDKEWGAWPGEYFVNDVNGALPIMKARIEQIANWGYDWVEFDNMDWVFDDKNRSKYNISANAQDGEAYYLELCDYAHSLGLKCMAKNTVQGAQDFEGVLYESYNNEFAWWDTDGMLSFMAGDKLVIINHYKECACNDAYQFYLDEYGQGISFICEDKHSKKYLHFND